MLSSVSLITITYVLEVLTCAFSAAVCGLAINLLVWWSSTDPSTMITVSLPSSPGVTSMSVRPASYRQASLILSLVAGIGGVVDSVLTLFCLLSIDFIYSARRHKLALVGKDAARRGVVPTWLWAVLLFIASYSVGRSFAGFVGGYAEENRSTREVVVGGGRDSTGRYVAPDQGGFSFGGWVCALGEVLVDRNNGDQEVSRAQFSSMCVQDKAARGLIVPLFVVNVAMLVVLVVRFRRQKKKTFS